MNLDEMRAGVGKAMQTALASPTHGAEGSGRIATSYAPR